MRNFEYRALGADGVTVTGQAWAEGELGLDRDLETRGLLLTRAREARRLGRAKTGRLTRAELIQFCSSLATLNGAGIPLVEGLRGLEQRAINPRVRWLMGDMRSQLEAGSSLSEVVESHPGAFPKVFRASVSAGEVSGSLERILLRLTQHMEWTQTMRSTTAQALIYPLVLLTAICGLIAILLMHVLPNIIGMLPGGVADLPVETRVVLACSTFLIEHALLLGGLLGAAVLALVAAQKTSVLRTHTQRWILSIPWLGTLASKLAISKFAATAAVLKTAGCDLITMLKVGAGTTGNAAIESALIRVARRVESGGMLSRALEREPLIDALLVQVVSVGEHSGRLGEALERLAEHYERDVPRCVQRTLAIFEPALLIAAGALVAFILLAAMLPIFDLYDSLG